MRSSLLLLLLAGTAAADTLEVTLGDVTSPSVVTLRESGEHTVVVRSPAKREVDMRAFAGAHIIADGASRTSWSTAIDGSTSLVVRGEGFVVFYDERKTVFDERHIYGAPTDDSIASRELRRYAPGFNPLPSNPAAIARWFAAVDERFFVFPTRNAGCWMANLVEGEPLLVWSYGKPDNSLAGIFLRANGEHIDCMSMDADTVTTQRPARIGKAPPAKAPQHWSQTFEDEEFLRLDQARIAKYVAAKAKAKECSDKWWDKLDPDGRAYRYDLVTYDSKGNVVQVESYKLKLSRKVDAACKLQKLRDERDAIRDVLAADYERASRASVDAVTARLNR